MDIGHKSAVSVRLLHSAVRKFVWKGGRWNSEEYGCPANQGTHISNSKNEILEDMLHTIILFSHVHIRGLEKIGAILSSIVYLMSLFIVRL